MTHYWWDDAVADANRLTLDTMIRHRVFRTKGGWTVEPIMVTYYIDREVCS